VNASPQRLFFAIWPDAALCETLLARSRDWLRETNGRLVAPENLHITLAFLGNVDADQRACVERSADNLDLPAFDLILDRLAYWPRPRVVWAGSGNTPAAFTELAIRLQQDARDCGLQIDRRPPVAHLTLKRKVTRATAGAGFDPVCWRVAQFHLVASDTQPAGPLYERLRSWPLR
jgi:2'-5' RNA ligase